MFVFLTLRCFIIKTVLFFYSDAFTLWNGFPTTTTAVFYIYFQYKHTNVGIHLYVYINFNTFSIYV